MKLPGAQRGFILMSVVVAITLLAAIAFMLGYQGASQTGIASGELERDRLRYIAEAGMAHAKLQLAKNTSCSGYTDIPRTDFGGDSYSVEFPDKSSSPVRIRAIGELQGGGKFKLESDSVRAYQAPLAVNLQLSKTGGKDAILDDFYPIRNYGGANYLQVNSASWQQRPVLQFDLSEVPAGAKILSARLELMQQSVNNGGAVAVHRMTRDWVEGTRNGGGIADGATWQTHDGSGAWLQQGGEFDATVYGVTQVSGAKSGNWVAWDIRDLVQEWVSGNAPNFGLMLAGDGTVTGAQYASKDTSGAEQAPKLTIAYACECGKTCTAAPPVGKIVLLVVVDPANLTAQEADKQALIESWGHTVNLIDESASQGEFDAAVAIADVAYVNEDISSGTLGTRLREATIGVVIEDQESMVVFGFGSAYAIREDTDLEILDNSHYITATLAIGVLSITNSVQPLVSISGYPPADSATLGQAPGAPVHEQLTTIDTGGTVDGGGTAAGRRVKLPWGGND
ncbi:MAG: DNRLRE domain-containing protein, partial [Gammaproteobacteria bacterium]|nr:DNRLRE domain-containing protein [Gammaproteobacteria bacterium]